MSEVKIEQVLKINSETYSVGDVVMVKFSDEFISTITGIKLPLSTKIKTGRISSIGCDNIIFDISKKYHSDIEVIMFDNIIDISRLSLIK